MAGPTDKNKNASKKGQTAAPNVPQPTSNSANKPEVKLSINVNFLYRLFQRIQKAENYSTRSRNQVVKATIASQRTKIFKRPSMPFLKRAAKIPVSYSFYNNPKNFD